MITISSKITEKHENAQLERRQVNIRALVLGKFASERLNWIVTKGTEKRKFSIPVQRYSFYSLLYIYISCPKAVLFFGYCFKLYHYLISLLKYYREVNSWLYDDAQIPKQSHVLFSGKGSVIHLFILFIKPRKTKQNNLSFQGYVMTINIVPSTLIQ